MNKYAKYTDYVLMSIFIGLSASLLVYAVWCAVSPECQQRIEAERILRSEGVVFEKVADPAGYTWGFLERRMVYRPDRYYLKVRLDNGSVTEMNVDAVTYMNTNVGDRVKNR